MKSAEPDDEPGGMQVAVSRSALKKWAKVCEFALGLPGAAEEFPWGESLAKVNKKVSCRTIAPKRLMAEPDAAGRGCGG